MLRLLSILKWIDAPGSIAFLIICCVTGAVLGLVWPRRRRLTLTWFAVVLGGYLVLSLPYVANGIAGSLPALETPTDPAAPRLDALVIFDGDNRNGRVREAKRLYDSAAPAVVWSLGREPWMEKELPKAGIPGDRVRHDLETTTTREQIAWVKQFLEEHRAGSVAIVASRLQMPRVEALFKAADLHVQLAPSAADAEPATSGVRQFVPTYFALRVSRDALYEHIALRYYRYKGWIR